ncbi:MAG: thioesterase family protein [Acidilobaceae archaeon]
MPIYTYRSTAYWNETDAAGIVHFSNYFRYCERAEEEFLKSIVEEFLRLREKYGIIVPRVKASCSYSYPIYPHDDYRVDIIDIELGNKSITYKYEIFNESRGGVKSAECEIVVAVVDPRIMKSIEIPKELREILKKWGAREKY